MPHSFADRLERLFEVVRKPGGVPFSLAEVAVAVNAQGRTKLSASYLSELRSGRKDNPNVWVADALARFFGQPLEYFVEDDMEPAVPSPTGRSAHADLRDTDLQTQAGRLNFLLVATQPAGGRAPESRQVAQWLRRDGLDVDEADIDAARAGTREASSSLVSALADYFQVPEAFLTSAEVAAAMAGDIRLLRVMRDRGLRKLAFRANSLNASDRERVADLVNRLASDEGMSPDELDY